MKISASGWRWSRFSSSRNHADDRTGDNQVERRQALDEAYRIFGKGGDPVATQ
jgi:hypothetical protein